MLRLKELRDLPSVEEMLAELPERERWPHALAVQEARRAIENARARLRAGDSIPRDELSRELLQSLLDLAAPSQRTVINATGVVLHTNLGRAPLASFTHLEGYSNLEYDLTTGKRGKRDAHTALLIERLFQRPGIVVNNNAAAVFLALHELAFGREVIVSRGELIEIGDGFRIPEIMQRSGAILREVGTTNRTHIADYREAINERTALLLRVHPSNFQIHGFTSKPELVELAALSKERGIALYEDLGSGCVAPVRSWGVDEPTVSESLSAGADLVSFSGDKLLGGPQAGFLLGRADMVTRLRRNPMFRALRLDKLMYQALETTLRCLLLEQWDQLPALRMIRQSAAQIRQRAEAFLQCIPEVQAELMEGESLIGGGSTPNQTLPTWLVAVHTNSAVRAEAELRAARPLPVIARVEEDRLLLDIRTVLPEQEGELAKALQALSR